MYLNLKNNSIQNLKSLKFLDKIKDIELKKFK